MNPIHEWLIAFMTNPGTWTYPGMYHPLVSLVMFYSILLVPLVVMEQIDKRKK